MRPISALGCGCGRCFSTTPTTRARCCVTSRQTEPNGPPRKRFVAARRANWMSGLHLRPNDFRLQVGVEARFTGLVSPTGLLVTTEGHGLVELHLAVQPDGSGLQALRDSVCTAEVIRPRGSSQPVGT